MQVVRKDDVAIYNLTRGKQLPGWLSDRKRRRLQQEDPELRQRIELIQDFTMPTSSRCLTLSRGGDFIFVAGTYKPRIRCYEADQLAMKFERQLNAEVVAMECLSDDFSKLVMALDDRSVEVHARYGYHYRVRVPKHTRDLAYHYPSCDLMVVGSSPELWRINLDQGRFLAPYAVEHGGAINVCAVNPMHGLVCAGTDAGFVECFDPREKARVGAVDVASRIGTALVEGGGIPEVTAIDCFDNGLTMAIGTSSGHVLTYDIRSARPELTKDHYNGLPIKTVKHHPESGNIISADAKGIKVWDQHTGENFTSLEAVADINQVCVVPGSGLMFAANESEDLFTYFIPSLAPAPKWCSYLDSITEELEETTEAAVYDDYKFVTREDVEKLGISDLIGTPILRAYMHGFFMDTKLYLEAKSIADPFAYDEYRKQKLEKLLEDGDAKRITLRKAARALPKVNRRLAQRLFEENEGINMSKKRKKKKQASLMVSDGGAAAAADDPTNPLGDARFKAMFEDTAFEVDEASEQWRLLHPSEPDKVKSRPDLLVASDKFDVIEESGESEVEGKGSADEDSDSDDDALGRAAKERAEQKEAAKKAKAKAKKAEKKRAKKAQGAAKVSMLELNEGETYRPGMSLRDVAGEAAPVGGKKSFASRLKSEGARPKMTVRDIAGGKEMTFTVSGSKPAAASGAPAEPRREGRRGVNSLGLKRPPKQKYWRGKPV
mmetsp:Transcript_31097/g.81477  ORF Transcript_31097/g.81477 Transcript_31097/m.81477 type:complete len:719 (-) Transcript_31097:51-2207(-)